MSDRFTGKSGFSGVRASFEAHGAPIARQICFPEDDLPTSAELADAGIDVLAEEPPVNGDALLDPDIPNLVVTPHIAWAAREARQRAVDEIAANIDSFMRGGRRRRVV